MLLSLTTFVGCLIFTIFAVTQVVLPLWFGKPTFQLLRGKRLSLEGQLALADEALQEVGLQEDLKDKHVELEKREARLNTEAKTEPPQKRVQKKRR